MEYSDHILPVVEGKSLPQCKWVLEDGKWKKVWWYPEPEERTIEGFVEIDEVEQPRKAKVETEGDLSWWFACGECQMQISKGDKYCRQCGRELDWSGIYLKETGAERMLDDLRSEGAEREQEPGEP